MIFSLRIKPLWLLSAALLGCSGGTPSGPSLGSLRLTVLGLPAGSPAAITITGPGGFSQSAQASQTFTQLTPGSYTVTAGSVVVGGADYSPSPASQTLAVAASENPVNVSVFYSRATGNLSITISGLGSRSAAAVTVTGPGYSQDVPSSTTLLGLDPGDYLITARDTVAAGGISHSPAPTTQSVTISANATASASVQYSPPSSGQLNFHIAGLYITQSTQTYPATVPLVSNRNGYLRVFVIANRTTSPAEIPNVRVRFYNGGMLPVDSALLLNTQALSVPTAVDESSLSYTWNLALPASLIQPGLSIQAQVDPANAIGESSESDNLFPAVGTAGADVQPVPTLRVTFVPILQTSNGLQGNVTETNKENFIDITRRMHPIAAVDAVVSVPFPTSITLEADGSGWEPVLSELNAARLWPNPPCGNGRYCYGIVKVPYSQGVAGIAYVSQGSADAWAALGWDHIPSGSIVAAHELAHNWGRNHAPCGGPANPDPLYPQSDGTVGSYGLDVGTATLKLPTISDIMGYCDPKWIGEYNYRGVMNYRLAHPLVVNPGTGQPVQPTLLVWGRIRNEELVLEPAFQLTTVPALPASTGPYSVEGLGQDGSMVFKLSFTPNRVADLPGASVEHFAYAVPLSQSQAERLFKLRLTGKGRAVERQTQQGIRPDSLNLRRESSRRVILSWNAAAYPVVLMRDAKTGQFLSFARGGAAHLPTGKTQVDLLLSDGVRSRLRRMRVAP